MLALAIPGTGMGVHLALHFGTRGPAKACPGRRGKRRAELVAQHPCLDFLDFAIAEMAELERPKGEPDQPVYLQPDMFEQALHLAVLAFTQS